MLVEFKDKKAVPFWTLNNGDTFKKTDDYRIWLKCKDGPNAVCLQDGMYSLWDEESDVILVKAKVVVDN